MQEAPRTQSHPDFSEPVIRTEFSSRLDNVFCAHDYPVINTDGQTTFRYRDVGEWEGSHPLVTIDVQALPDTEPTCRVDTRYTVDFPLHDYRVTGLPWETFITNSHDRPTYELLKANTQKKPLTLLNWDRHEDIFYREITDIYDPQNNNAGNWVFTAHYFGLTKSRHYHFEKFMERTRLVGHPQTIDVPLSENGLWHFRDDDESFESDPHNALSSFYRDETHVGKYTYILCNIPTDLANLSTYYKDILESAPKKSIWLSLDADCFSRTQDFDQSGYMAEVLSLVLKGAFEFADRIALVTFARSPRYTGDLPGVNSFFVNELKAKATNNSHPETEGNNS